MNDEEKPLTRFTFNVAMQICCTERDTFQVDAVDEDEALDKLHDEIHSNWDDVDDYDIISQKESDVPPEIDPNQLPIPFPE